MNQNLAKHACQVFLLAVLFFGTAFLNKASAQTSPSLPPLNDPPSGESLPGKFIWFDLATPALEDQKDFYRSVFGWTFRSPTSSAENYTLVMNDNRAIAGMFSAEPPGGEQDGATWIALMAVPSADQAVSTAKSAGGTVEVSTAHIPRRGRHALLRDPAGAIFGVLQSDSGDPPDVEIPVGGILWVDLFARDPDRMAEFYGRLAPYEVTKTPVTDEVERTMLHAHDRPRAGMVPVDEEANRSAWVPYVRVNDVESTLQKAVDGGGFTIVAPDPLLMDGNLAIFVDPNGAVTGIVKFEYADEEGS